MAIDGEYVPSPAAWVRDQVEEYEGSGGTTGTTLRETGLPVVIVTNRGAKTGAVRKTPLMRVEHEGSYAAVGSKGGAPQNPVWVYNLRKNPQVVLQDGARTWEMTAREVTGDERAAWWERAVAAYPPYADYQLKTDRLIPVFVLEATAGPGVSRARQARAQSPAPRPSPARHLGGTAKAAFHQFGNGVAPPLGIAPSTSPGEFEQLRARALARNWADTGETGRATALRVTARAVISAALAMIMKTFSHYQRYKPFTTDKSSTIGASASGDMAMLVAIRLSCRPATHHIRPAAAREGGPGPTAA